MADGEDGEDNLSRALQEDGVDAYQSIFWPENFDPESIFENPQPSTSRQAAAEIRAIQRELKESAERSSNTRVLKKHCPRCKVGFGNEKKFKRHLKLGNCYFREFEESKYPCPYASCNTSCKFAYTLDRHIR